MTPSMRALPCRRPNTRVIVSNAMRFCGKNSITLSAVTKFHHTIEQRVRGNARQEALRVASSKSWLHENFQDGTQGRSTENDSRPLPLVSPAPAVVACKPTAIRPNP